jgi:Fe-S cluster assembly iron-binding protein IscA
LLGWPFAVSDGKGGERVLTLTENAVEVVTNLVQETPQAADDAGLRIFAQASEQGPALALAVVDAPAESDQVVEEAGARVFVDAAVTEALDDKALDADVVEGNVRFTVIEQ